MDKAKFVYVTYISTTPEKLWDALINPEITRQYWGNHRNASDWQPGSPWRHEDYSDSSHVDIVGQVIESDPPNRLILSWASPASLGDPEKTSRVTLEIAPIRDTMRLTVTHEELDEAMLKGISGGWPLVFSNLKTLLETGKVIPGLINPPVRKPAAATA